MTDQNQDWFAQNGITNGAPVPDGQTNASGTSAQPAPVSAAPADDWFAQNGIGHASEKPAALVTVIAPDDTRSTWDKIKLAVAGPTTALNTPLGETKSKEISGINDIIHGEFAKGGHKIWDSEKIGAHNVMPGSPVEWAIRQFNPDFHGLATKEYIEDQKAKNPNPGEKPLIDIAQFVSKEKHPIAKALTEVGQGLTSPENVAIMYGTGGLGLVGNAPQALKAFGVMQKMISAGFAYQALQGAYEHSEAFKDAMDKGDAVEAEYQLTHALASGTMALQAGSHAAEGVKIPGTNITPVEHAMPFLSDTDKAVIGKTAEVVGKAANAAGDFTKQKLTDSADAMGRVIGRTDDFSKALTAVANKLGKKTGPEFREKVDRVSNDLKEIINNDVDNKIVDPKTAAQAIDQHLNSLEAPLQAEAGAAKDSVEPVVPNFGERLRQRLDKFFDDNRQKYGSTEEVDAIKQRLIDRLTGEHDLGDGTKVSRDLNLYEAENARQGLNKSAGDVFENGTSSGYRAASGDAANFLREVIDEGYDQRGVSNVKETRGKEADLIDVRDALSDAQGVYEAQKNMPALLKMFTLGKMAGLIGTLGAHLLGGNIVSGTLAAGTLWKAVHEHYTKNIESNLSRAQGLAARDQNAAATTTGEVPPVQGPGAPPPQAPPPPGMPTPPVPPTPATPPLVNHALNGALSSYFGNFLNEEPYQDLMQRFVNQVANMKQDIAAAKADPNYKPKYTQDQIDRAMKVQDTVNREHAREHAQVEKENKTADAKYQKELVKYQKDIQVKKQQADEAEIQRQMKEQADAKAAEQARIDKIKADPRVAHSSLFFSTDPALPINQVEGRSSREAHRHEHGHIMANVAEGLNPFAYVTDTHPDAVESGAAAQVHTDVSGAEEGPKGIAQRVVGILGGPAFDEVHQNISLSRNTGARADIARAREILREEGGLRGNQLEKVFDALYDKAKEHVSNPEALGLVEANADLRESGIHPSVHMTAGRMESYVKLLKGAYRNGETPSTEGVREGDSDGAVSEGKPADTGDVGSEQNGAVEGTRAESPQATREEPKSSDGRGVNSEEQAEKSNLKRVTESAREQKFKVSGVTPEGPFEDEIYAHSFNKARKIAEAKHDNATELGVEVTGESPDYGEYKVPEKAARATPNSKGLAKEAARESVLSTMYHELGHYMVGHNEGHIAKGMLTSSHPEMPRSANAAVSWNLSDLIDGRGRVKADKLPGVLRMLAGGVAADEVFSNLNRENNPNFEIKRGISDGSTMARFLRAAGYPESGIHEMMNKTVDEAKEHLTKPHVRDIIQENAGVREPNLSTQYHYSPERLKSMGEEAARRGANGESNNGRVDGEGNPNGGEDVAGREGGAAPGVGEVEQVEKSNLKPGVPPERTTGRDDVDKVIRDAGGIPGGTMKGFEYEKDGKTVQYPDTHLFHDPESGTTLAVKADEDITPESIREKLEQSRAAYTAAEAKKTEKSNLSHRDAIESHIEDRDLAAENILNEYKNHLNDKGYRQQWDLVSAPRLKKIWNDYAKQGFVRDEKGINDISQTILRNISKIEVNNMLTGHEQDSPEDYAETITGEKVPENYFDKHDSFFDDENGAWRISDYAAKPLADAAIDLRQAKTAEDKLQVIDRILNITHQRSDLPGWFVEGGSKTLNELAGKTEKSDLRRRHPAPPASISRVGKGS